MITGARDPVRYAEIMRQPRGVALCQALGVHYPDDRTEVVGELDGYSHVADATLPGHVHRGAVLALVDQVVGTGVMAARGKRDAQATISLRLDWLAPARLGTLRCTVHQAILNSGTAFLHGTIAIVGEASPFAVATGQFALGANPGGSNAANLFEGEPPLVPLADLPDFDSFLGLVPDGPDVIVPPLPRLIGHPGLPAFHGGIVAAALDEAAARVARDAGASRPVVSHATFLRPVVADRPLRLSAKIIRSGRSMAVVQVAAWQDDPSRIAALGEMIALKRPPLD